VTAPESASQRTHSIWSTALQSPKSPVPQPLRFADNLLCQVVIWVFAGSALAPGSCSHVLFSKLEWVSSAFNERLIAEELLGFRGRTRRHQRATVIDNKGEQAW